MNDSADVSGTITRAKPADGWLLVRDDYRDDRPPGTVIGTSTGDGTIRLGRDRERGLSIDHGALRIRYLEYPDWGRAALAYGPFDAVPGMAVAVSLLNGLATSQTPELPEGRRARLRRWIRTLPRPRWRRPQLKENLAVGWFPSAAPSQPTRVGACLVAAAGPREHGELRLRTAGAARRAVWGVQNLPLVLVAVLRDDSVAYYAGSMSGAHGFPGYPELRPLGIGQRPGAGGQVYAGIHQSILGEVKYRLDTRVYGTRVAMLPAFAAWHGGAHAADDLTGAGALDATPAATGAAWDVAAGRLDRTATGLRASTGSATALLTAPAPSGLVRALADVERPHDAQVSLRWRATDEGTSWRFTVGANGSEIVDAAGRTIASDPARRLTGGRHRLEVLDDGRSVAAYLDDDLVCGWQDVPEGAEGSRVGLTIAGAVTARRFEAHPRTMSTPVPLEVSPPWRPGDGKVVVEDDFTGAAGDLAGRSTTVGDRCWRRLYGDGTFEVDGHGSVHVRADVHNPNPGRTVYGVEWPSPDYADVAVDVTPPGTGFGQGHQGRSGIVLWQDPDNHFVLNHFIDDGSVGVSISAFLRVGGHERMYDYDAVWSNVATRVRHGVAHRLRVVCDGSRFLTFVDGEPVLYRDFVDYRADAPRLRITSVGLVANWEWGDDTGTSFARFTAAEDGSGQTPGHGSRG